MQKIGDIPNTRADNNGEFTDGNVAGGVPPTILPAEWFNTIQRELINLLAVANIEPDSDDFNQVATAVSKLITEGGFLKTVNNLSEIKIAGAVAQATARSNLGIAARFQKFTGSGSFTVPAGVTTLYISGCAGGGGGGGGSSSTASSSVATCGGGGGAGQSVQRVSVIVTPGQIIPVVVGTGGTSGAGGATGSNAQAGGSGGLTSFGTSLLYLLPASGGGQGGYGTGAVAGGVFGTGYPNGGWNVSGGYRYIIRILLTWWRGCVNCIWWWWALWCGSRWYCHCRGRCFRIW